MIFSKKEIKLIKKSIIIRSLANIQAIIIYIEFYLFFYITLALIKDNDNKGIEIRNKTISKVTKKLIFYFRLGL